VRTAIAVIVLGAFVAGCGGEPRSPTSATAVGAPSATATLTPVAPSADWPASSPAAERLDAARLGDLALRIRRGDYGRTAAVLIVRNGRLAFEEYFNGWSADRSHTEQSVSKSVTSLAVGLAAQSGRLSLSDPVARFFPSYQPLANVDDRKLAQTVRDLLTMQSGFDWSEDSYQGSPLQRLNDCRCDWLRFILDWRMRDMPGSRWEYISGNTILLGGIVGSATGQRLDQFLAAELFAPLGVSGASWFAGLPDGLPHAGGGLLMRTTDLAKIGQLILDGGTFRGRAVIAPGWLRESTTRVTRGVRIWAGRTFDYGYHWWLTDDRGSDIIVAAGAQGQFIFVSPRDQMVVAVNSDDEARWIAPIEFFFSHILPAVQ
jgi:CubicO group peptidase (beta-lactamase class C family)